MSKWDNKVAEYVEKIVSGLFQVEDDELREYCLQAFESFIRRCPKQITPHIHAIIQLCLEYVCYDPNYNYGEEEEDDSMDMDEVHYRC